jgi:hypothetical protein
MQVIKKCVFVLLFIPMISHAEVLYLACLVNGSYSSSNEKSMLPPTKITVEVNEHRVGTTISIQAPEKYAMSLSTVEQKGFIKINLSTTEKFDILSSTEDAPYVTTGIRINRMTGQINASRTFSGQSNIESNIYGSCEKVKLKKF